jgi:hypothetical protein
MNFIINFIVFISVFISIFNRNVLACNDYNCNNKIRLYNHLKSPIRYSNVYNKYENKIYFTIKTTNTRKILKFSNDTYNKIIIAMFTINIIMFIINAVLFIVNY